MKKIIGLLCLYAAVCITSCKNKEEKTVEEKYSVTTPLVMDTSFTKEYVAQIQSLQNIEIRAMVKGYLSDIYVDEGQHVRAGQTLFKIMPKEYEAEYQKAKAEARTAELEMQNVKTLAEKNIVSQTELSLAQAKYESAKAEVARTGLFLSFTTIRAPFDGVIDRIRFKTGSLIDEGALLTSLSNNQQIYAYFNVSETEYLNFRTQAQNDNNGMVNLVLANGQPYPYSGKIVNIEGEFDNTTGNIAFRAKFPNPDLLLKHGETGKVQLKMDLKNAMIIPQKATYEIQDKTYVYVVDSKNMVKAKNITIKQKLSNIYVVEGGLAKDDKILLEGIQSIKEDDKVITQYTPPQQVIEHLQLIQQ